MTKKTLQPPRAYRPSGKETAVIEAAAGALDFGIGPTAEQLFNAAHSLGDPATTADLPIRWMLLDEITDAVSPHDEGDREHEPSTTQLMYMSPHFLDAPPVRDSFQQALQALHVPGVIQEARALELTAGIKASVLLFELVVDSGRKAHLVVNLSKDPVGHPLAHELESEYDGLTRLSDGLSQVNNTVKKKLRVAEPLARSSVDLGGVGESRYPYFISPFVRGQEILLQAFPISETRIFFAYYYGGTTAVIDKSVNFLNRKQVGNAERMQVQYRRAITQTRSEEFALKRLSEGAIAQSYNALRDEMVRAYAMVYLAFGGYYPVESAITAGDWMGRIGKGELQLCLVSFRGGTQGAITTKDWIKSIKGQEEVSVKLDELTGVGIFQPFAYFPDDYFRERLQEAEDLLNPAR